MRKVRIALVGTGAFGIKHLDALRNIPEAEVTCLVGRTLEGVQAVAKEYQVEAYTTDFEEMLLREDVDAVILCTPTQMHAAQSIACLKAGKHVEVEIPLADNWKDAMEVLKLQEESHLVAMVGHTRRFNPSHQWLKKKIDKGELTIQQMDVQTYFLGGKILML